MSVYIEEGDAIKGEVISCQARTIGKIAVVKGSGSHRAQRIVIKRNAYCIIDTPIRIRR